MCNKRSSYGLLRRFTDRYKGLRTTVGLAQREAIRVPYGVRLSCLISISETRNPPERHLKNLEGTQKQ